MRPRRWHRWVVVIHDLAPMPPRQEATEAFIFRRPAEHARRMTHIAQSRNIARRLVVVTIERASDFGRTPLPARRTTHG